MKTILCNRRAPADVTGDATDSRWLFSESLNNFILHSRLWVNNKNFWFSLHSLNYSPGIAEAKNNRLEYDVLLKAIVALRSTLMTLTRLIFLSRTNPLAFGSTVPASYRGPSTVCLTFKKCHSELMRKFPSRWWSPRTTVMLRTHV